MPSVGSKRLLDNKLLELYTAYYANFISYAWYGIIMWSGSPSSEINFKQQKRVLRVLLEMASSDSCISVYREHKILTMLYVFIFILFISIFGMFCNMYTLMYGNKKINTIILTQETTSKYLRFCILQQELNTRRSI